MGHCLPVTVRFTGNGTGSGGLFDWGGTPLKKYQRRPMVNSTGSEIQCRELKSNVSLTVFCIARDTGAKAGLSEQWYPS